MSQGNSDKVRGCPGFD